MKRLLLGFLVLLNLIVLGFSGFLLYYYWVLWGIPRYAVSLEIPLIVSIIVGIASLVLVILKRKWWLGLGGFFVISGLSFLVVWQMYCQEIGPVMNDSSIQSIKNQTLTEEERITAIILANQRYEDNHYVIVDPITQFEIFLYHDVEYIEKYYDIKDWEKDADYDKYIQNVKRSSEDLDAYIEYYEEEFGNIIPADSSLMERFFEINKDPVPLTLKSAPEDGYLIDYYGDATSDMVFEDRLRAGFGNWGKNHPRVIGFVEISRVGYDPETGFAIANVQYWGGGLIGFGDLCLYRYSNGKLIEIDSILISQS